MGKPHAFDIALTDGQIVALEALLGLVSGNHSCLFCEHELAGLIGCKRQRAIAILSGLVAKGVLQTHGEPRNVFWYFTDAACDFFGLHRRSPVIFSDFTDAACDFFGLLD